MKRYFFKIRCAAIILIAAGYGWGDGHYIPANSSILAYVFQFIILFALLIMGIRSLSISENENHKSNWSVTGLSIFSGVLLLINIVKIIHWGHNSNANSFGSHNSFAGMVPVTLLIIGNILWAISIVQSIRHSTKANHLSKSQYNIF
jgi:NADH:ubiquinone oxidoreductase subunit 6 (subunit J)